MIKLIVFDLDNVLIDGEAIDEIGKLAGVETEISEITKKAMEGNMDFGEALKERVALLKGVSVDDIEQVVKKIPLMKGADETIRELKKRGYKIATITGSFEIIASRLKYELDLDYSFSNSLQEDGGILSGTVSGPLVQGSKADVLLQILETEKISKEECAAVGDGANDISMLEEAGLGIAFNAKPVLKEIADVVIENRDLRELLTIFDGKSDLKGAEDDLKKDGTDLKEVKGDSGEVGTDLKEVKGDLVESKGDLVESKGDLVESKADLKEVKEDSKESKEFSSVKNKKYAGKSFSELLKEKRQFEKQLNEFTKERDDLNAEARKEKHLRDDLNASIKENLEKALKYRNERDLINQDVKKYKKKREEANNELKKMEWASGRRDVIRIEEEIKKLDKTIETEVMDIRKENELVKKVTDLRKKLQTMEKDVKVKDEAVELKKLSESYHTKVVELSNEAQEIHDKMLEYFHRIDQIRVKADDAHSKFIQIREKATQKHEEVKKVLKEIRVINKNLDKKKAKERDLESQKTKEKNYQEKEKAEDIYRKFKDGKKLSTEEFLLLQRHNID